MTAKHPLTLLALAISLFSLPSLASTETDHPIVFDLQADTLENTLSAIGRQSGQPLVADPRLLGGKQAPAIRGQLTVEQALQQALQGSGLQLVRTPGGSLTLVAQDPDATLELSAIDIAGQSHEASNFTPYSLPGSVHVISQEQLQRIPYSRPGDMFRNVPGVNAADNASSAGLELNIRGMQGMGRVKTMVDGTLQSASSYKGYSGNRDDTYVDPDLIAGIDIRKGPDAGPQAAGVVGGIVNMRTLDARDIIRDPDQNWGLRLKGMYGNNIARGDDINASFVTNFSNGAQEASFYTLNRGNGKGSNYRQYTNSAGRTTVYPTEYQDIGSGLPDRNAAGSLALAWRPLDNWEITAAHAQRYSGNYYAGSRGASSWRGKLPALAGKEVYNTSLQSETWLLKNRVRFADDHSLELSHIKYQSLSGFYSSTLGYFAGANWQYALSDINTETHGLRYAWQPDNPWFDLRAGLWTSTLDNDTAGLATRIETRNRGAELWNNSQIPLPLGLLEVKYGVSLEQEKADSQDTSASSSSLAPVARGERSTLGSFVQGNWSATSWLSLNAGLQHDEIELEDTKANAEPERRYRSSNPSYGLVLKPWQGVQVYAQWSQGARAPSLREAYINANGVIPNANLKTEKADNFEYGLNLLFQGVLDDQDQLGVKLSWFKNHYKDYISRMDRRAMGEGTTSGGRYKFGNIDKAVYEGYELSLDYDIGWSFLQAGLTYYDKIEYCYPGYVGNTASAVSCNPSPASTDWGANYVPPRQEKNATLGVRLFERTLTLGARVTTSTKNLYGGSFIGSYVQEMIWDHYEVYDLFGSYKAGKNLELGFSVENLRDRFYIQNMANNLDALPAPGRTARLMVTAHF